MLLPRGAKGWSAIFECGISLSYSPSILREPACNQCISSPKTAYLNRRYGEKNVQDLEGQKGMRV